MLKPSKIILSIIFALSAVLIIVFGLRTYHYYERLERFEVSGFEVESLRGWMTMPYISKVYEVDEDALYEALGILKESNTKLGLRQIIDKYALNEVDARRAIEKEILRAKKPGSGGD